LDYPRLVGAMQRCTLLMTDSGGIQEEAPGLGKPALVLRETTERPEAVMAGTAKLVGTDPAQVVPAAAQLLSDPAAYAAMANATNPFGDGHATERIMALVKAYFRREEQRGE
jgi:UDP-N-acetylglucosamine 2-epimerase (non-hydrolysing)